MSSNVVTALVADLPTITAIIPTFRRGQYLIKTLRSLREQTRQPDEILVLDQTPTEEYEPSVKDFLEAGHEKGDFCWIRLTEPAVSKARNRAAQETQCDILLYLDDDIEPASNLIQRNLGHYSDPVQIPDLPAQKGPFASDRIHWVEYHILHIHLKPLPLPTGTYE